MKRLIVLALAVFAATALVAAHTAEAKRLGGGRSIGSQRQVTPAPTPPAASSPAPAASAPTLPGKAAPAAPSAGSRWLGPLAGLAAGLGLAALLAHFGLPEGFGSILLLGLLIFVGFLLVRMFFARRSPPTRTGVQYAGAAPGGYGTQVPPRAAFDAGGKFEPVFGGSATLEASPAAVAGRFPPGFDPGPLAEQAKMQFRRLQAAYDSGDRKALADVMTPDMFAGIVQELAERGAHVPTEVVALDAEVLEVTTEGVHHWASVNFKGMLREDGTVLPKPFEETWHLSKPVDNSSGWLLAGIQQPA
jgi:predicted lipid-binding transport protein (Tim44 family)